MRILIVIFAALAVACGKSPTEPQGPRYPTVAGNYSGNLSFVFPELQTTANCPATTTITQTEGRVSIAPIIATGACGGQSIPFGAFNIDTNGAIEGGSATGSFNEPSCGTY